MTRRIRNERFLRKMQTKWAQNQKKTEFFRQEMSKEGLENFTQKRYKG